MEDAVTFPKTWAPPPELTRERPRPVRLSGTGIFLSVLSAIMIVGALPTALAMRVADARTAARTESLRVDGRDAGAEITGLRRVGKNKEARASYAFVAGGSRYEATVGVPESVWRGLRVGDPLPVRYLSDHPTVNYPSGWQEHQIGPVPPILVAVTLIGVGAVLRFVLRKERRLLEEGVPSVGVITRCRRVKGGYAARYQFRTDGGEVRKGRAAVHRRLETGEAVCVLVDPDNPRKNATYPVKLYRLQSADGAA